MIGHGAKLVGSVTGTIGKLTNIDWSGAVADDIQTTDFDSGDKYHEFEAGLKDAGEITGDLRYDKTLFNTVLDAVGGSTETWTLTLSDNSELVCKGYIRSLGLAVPMGDSVMMPIAIKFSGKPYFPSSSSSSSLSSSSSSSKSSSSSSGGA